MKHMAPGSICHHIFSLRSNFPLHFYSDLLIQKSKNTLLHFILFAIYFIQSTTIYLTFLPISGAVTRKGLTTSLIRRVARCCYLCPWAVYVVLLGSPVGLVTLVSYLREIPTATVLHHPFLFGEIRT